jgi:hypothetical protein
VGIVLRSDDVGRLAVEGGAGFVESEKAAVVFVE